MIYQPLLLLIVSFICDDCFLLEKVQYPGDCASKFNHDLRSISDWVKRWLVTMNETKTKAIVFSAKRDKPVHPPLILNSCIIGDVTVHEHLGFTFPPTTLVSADPQKIVTFALIGTKNRFSFHQLNGGTVFR